MHSSLSSSNTMSPFANTPHLWLTGHLRRLDQGDQAVKIQAVARGFLVRQQQKKTAPPQDLAGLMHQLGLGVWAKQLPSAADCLGNQDLAEKRLNALWHARVSLRLAGLAEHIQDLEWADYREQAAALQERAAQEEAAQEHAATPATSFWERILKLPWE